MIRTITILAETLVMFDSPLINTLQSGLDYSSARQEALSQNIANINTPGYQRKDASFDSVLAAAESTGNSSIFTLADGLNGPSLGRDNPEDISPQGDSPNSPVQITSDTSGAMRLDGNNIDLDVEMGRLAKNEIYYQGLSQLIAGEFADLKMVVKGG
jgi:flagellar basal-body rod protein FlgB